MSDFHKRKAEAKADRKLVYSQRSLDEWKKQGENEIRKQITEEANRRIKEANEHLDSELKKIKEQMTQEALNQAFILMIGIPVKILKNEYGWGKRVRLPEFAAFVEQYYREFSEGEVSIHDYQKIVWEETGIGFTMTEENETVEQAVARYDSWMQEDHSDD